MGLAWALVLAAACHADTPQQAAPARDERPNFLLIDIDSLRADQLHASHLGEPIAPRLSSLAEQGAQFQNMFSQSSWTMPSLASLLTGRYPPSFTSANPRDERIGDLGLVLPELLGMYGYHSAVAYGDTVAVALPAFSRGFDQRLTHAPSSQPDFYQQPLIGYLASEPGEPFLLMVHNMDLHRPVPPPPAEMIRRHVPDGPMPPCTSLNETYKRSRQRLGEAAARSRTLGCHRAALASYDRVVGAVLDELQRSGLRRRTVILVTSDHGEEFFEHGELGHGELQFDSVLRVPLVISDPELPEPQLVTERVQTVDLLPTILERAAVPPPHDLVGSSLLPLLGLSQGSYQERDLFSFANASTAALRTSTHKLHHQVRAGTLERELYDLRSDPGELEDIFHQQPELAQELSERLERFIQERELEGAARPKEPGSEAFERQLKERGYWELVREP